MWKFPAVTTYTVSSPRSYRSVRTWKKSLQEYGNWKVL